MSKFRTCLLSIVSATAIFGAASASAANFEIWNGTAWVNSGTTHFVGTTTASYLGNALPCSVADFTVSVTGGVASVTGVSFGGSTACSNIVPRGLPWKVTINSTTAGGAILTIGDTASTTSTAGGANVFIPAPLNANCPSATGRAPVTNVTLTNSTGSPPGVASIQFSGTLGLCAVASTAPTHLRTTGWPPARVVP